MHFTKTVILFLSLLLLQNLCAQNINVPKKRFAVKSLNYENGLLDNSTNCIITDVEGFTWLSTFTGLQRFNGYRLLTINPVVGKDTLYINYPVQLFNLKDGCLLISVKEGLLEYNPHSDKFRLLTSLQKLPLFQFGIYPLIEDENGIWCIQQNKGLVIYSREGKFLQQLNYSNKDNFDNLLRSQLIFYSNISDTSGEYIYVNNLHNEVFSVNTVTKSYKIITTDEPVYSITCLHNKLYLSTSAYLEIIDSSGFARRTKKYLYIGEPLTGTSLGKDDDDNLYFSINGHLYNIDSSGSIKYEFTDQDKKMFVKNGNIQKIYVDKLKRIWLLSNNEVKRIENSGLLFDYFSYPNQKSNFTRALFYDEQKHILFAGGYNCMLQAYDSLSNPIWKKPLTIGNSEYLLNIQKLTSDKYLLTCYLKGFYIFNFTTKKITPLEQGIHSNLIKDLSNYPNNIQKLNDTTFLIATKGNVYKTIFKNGSLLNSTPLIPHSKDLNLTCLLYTTNKTLWVGYTNGTVLVKKVDSIMYLQIPGGFQIRSMNEDNAYHVCIGTEKGLFIYDNNAKLLKKVDISSGLRNDCIYAIANSGNDLFVSTNLGISCIRESGVVENFSKEMGLQENEFNTNAVTKTVGGKIFFGGINGVTSFYPSTLSATKDTCSIHITRLIVNDTSLNSSSGIWHGDTINLSYHQNKLRLNIAAIGFYNSDEYVYQYRMRGLDTNWETTSSFPEINYTLQPGNYTFEVRVHPVLSPGEISSKDFYITIDSPWWQTWWFITAIIAAVLSIIFLLVYLYNRKKYIEKIRNLETQQQVQHERERISRELHDNIGAQLSFIISNIDWTIESNGLGKEEEKKNLITINETAKNVMSNLRESIWALNKEKITIEEFADKLKAYIQNIISIKSGMQFYSVEDIQFNISFSPVDALNIFRICQEIINNIIKHAQATTVRLEIISTGKDHFSVTIQDDGKGFNTNQKASGHFGLENMQHRTADLNAHLSITSAKGEGTKISIYK